MEKETSLHFMCFHVTVSKITRSLSENQGKPRLGRPVSHYIWSWSNCINCNFILSLQAKVMKYLQDILNILYFLLAQDQDPKGQDFKYQFWNDLGLLKLAQRKSKKSTSVTQMMKRGHKNNISLKHAD